MRLGEVIRKWRRVEGKSTRQVALEIGISTSVLNRIESGGQGEGKQKGSVEMNGATLGKILVWLLNTSLLLMMAVGLGSAQQTAVRIGDILVGICDSGEMDTRMGATGVFDPSGNGVNEFDANNGLNMCMYQMSVNAAGNTYVMSSYGEVFGFDAFGNKIGDLQGPTPAGADRLGVESAGSPPTLSSIGHDQAGSFYYSINNGAQLAKVVPETSQMVAVYTLPGGGRRFSLMSDQHTMAYVALDTGNIRTYDLTTQTQGPDLVMTGTSQVVIALPDQTLIVRDLGGGVTHWAPGCFGCTPYQKIFTYSFPTAVANIASDPDGVSFRAIYVHYDPDLQEGDGSVYQVSVASGQPGVTIAIGGLTSGRYYSGSIGVYGDGMNSLARSAKVVQWKIPVPVGATTARKSVAVKNTGPVQIVVSGVSIRADDGTLGEFRISANQCQKGIRPGSHCNVWVTYTPTKVGTQTGVVEVYGNIPGGKQVVQLIGSGR